jgi:putative transposase
MIVNSDRVLRVEQPRVASRYFARHPELRERMPDDERFRVSVRRECLDHFLILKEKQLHRLLKTSVQYCNQARPHQGLRQQIAEPLLLSAPSPDQSGQVFSFAVLGGLHHDYHKAA